jgi:hypothetical protein
MTTAAPATKVARGRPMPSAAGYRRTYSSVTLLISIFLALALCAFSIWTSLNLQVNIPENDFSIPPIEADAKPFFKSDAANFSIPPIEADAKPFFKSDAANFSIPPIEADVKPFFKSDAANFSIPPIEAHAKPFFKSDAAKLEMRAPQSKPIVPSRRYHEISIEEFKDRAKTMTAYSSATKISNSSWFQPTKICKETCCAETVAISLDQDDLKIINTLDGLDLADVLIQQYHNPRQFKFFAPSLRLDMLPCLQPGTIIHIDNHRGLLNYFFKTVRPHIPVPYVLMTSESDSYSPSSHGKSLGTDNLLLKWYGQDMDLDRVPPHTRKDAAAVSKMTAFPLGLSKVHPQSPYLSRYLQLNNYTNPFAGEKKQRWIEWANNAGKNDEEADDLVFVKFRVQDKRFRRHIFDTLCNSSSSSSHLAKYKEDPVSCQEKKSKNHETYMAASRHLFGVSPPGAGVDCYRTYELLLLGVIPIVPEKKLGSVGLFEGLPVMEVPDLLTSNRTREDLVTIMKDYIQSPAFQDASFDGWERLFLKYWRRKLLKDTGREKDILRDEHGREYYQAWKYTTTKEQQGRIYCSDGVSCLVKKK